MVVVTAASIQAADGGIPVLARYFDKSEALLAQSMVSAEIHLG
jgi:hypothetical protein